MGTFASPKRDRWVAVRNRAGTRDLRWMPKDNLGDFKERAVELLRLHDPNYDLDDPELALAIAQEMMKVRVETIDEVRESNPR